jgi:hypothetical protein
MTAVTAATLAVGTATMNPYEAGWPCEETEETAAEVIVTGVPSLR